MTRLIVPCLAILLSAGSGATVSEPRVVAREALERAYQSNNIGAAWLERFEHAKAADRFREALRLAPALAIARFNLALALHYAGQPEAAEREARAAASALDTPHVDYLLGLIAKAQGHTAPAAAAFARVLQRDPQDASAGVMLGQLKLQQGDPRGAMAALEAALELEPHNVTAAYSLSTALARAGRTEDARRMLARFQSLRERGTATALGNGYLEQGKYGEAIVSTGAERDLVDRALPPVRFVAEDLPTEPGTRKQKPGVKNPQSEIEDSAVTLFDFDNDGDLDLLEAGSGGERLWRNESGRFSLLSTRKFPRPSPAAVATGLIAADYNNDGRADVLVLRSGGPALYRNDGGGRFTDVTVTAGFTSGTRGTEPPLAAAFVDLDHDGDLDLVLAARIWRNNGNGTFADITAGSGISTAGAVAVVPTDFDLQRDIDLLIASGKSRLALFKNQRNGSFRDAAAEAGLAAAPAAGAVGTGDLNRDGRTDFLVAPAHGDAVLVLSEGRSRFRMETMRGMSGIRAVQLVDYDNDGLLDMLAWTREGAILRRSVGDGWQDVPSGTLTDLTRGLTLPSIGAGRAIAVADLDMDGDQDVVVQHRGGIRILRNEGGHRRGALIVRLAARVSNGSAAGSKIEMRAGSLLQRRETSIATPPAAPFDVVFGLGGRPAADALRVLWPAGIVQAELGPAAGQPLIITELDRKPSSCPYLFTWNGSRFEFVTDFLGGGELGYRLAPGVVSQPDPDEYVRIPTGALQPKDGRFELRITNELEEVLYLDHVRLVVVAHPNATEVYPNEGLVSPPFPAPVLHVVKNRRSARAVLDDHGHNLRGATDVIDRLYPDDFALSPLRGYAEPHGVVIHVDGAADVLLLTGWTDYAFSSDNIAASQRGVQLSPPALQVRDSEREWRTVVPEIGIPVGRPQTVVVDLRRPELHGHREFRIATNMRVYWDRIAVADDAGGGSRIADNGLQSADLTWRGFSRELSPDGREPFAYDYRRVSTVSPWKTMVGRYTPEGDVRELLAAVDDRFVVARPGDEVAISFDALSLPSLPAGWRRTFLLYSDGFSKEMDLNSSSPDRVEPLPFHGMREYPPADGGPQTADRRPRSADRGSRLVTNPIPSIDALLLLAREDPR